ASLSDLRVTKIHVGGKGHIRDANLLKLCRREVRWAVKASLVEFDTTVEAAVNERGASGKLREIESRLVEKSGPFEHDLPSEAGFGKAGKAREARTVEQGWPLAKPSSGKRDISDPTVGRGDVAHEVRLAKE